MEQTETLKKGGNQIHSVTYVHNILIGVQLFISHHTFRNQILGISSIQLAIWLDGSLYEWTGNIMLPYI